jgi:hypothetical protein
MASTAALPASRSVAATPPTVVRRRQTAFERHQPKHHVELSALPIGLFAAPDSTRSTATKKSKPTHAATKLPSQPQQTSCLTGDPNALGRLDLEQPDERRLVLVVEPDESALVRHKG